MTVIASALHADGKFIALSDTLLSAPITSSSLPRMAMPITGHQGTVQTSDGEVIGLTSKCILLGQSAFLLWGGRQVVAEAIVRALIEAARTPNLNEFAELLKSLELKDHELSTVSLIYHSIENGRLKRAALNCDSYYRDSVELLCAGSGTFDFILDNELHTDIGTGERANHFLMEWVFRIAHAIERELRDTAEPIHYAYGGWYEIILYGDGAFRKVPYGVTFWSVSDNNLALLQTILSWPDSDGRAVIGRFSLDDAGTPQGVFNVLESGREEIELSTRYALESSRPPEFLLHIIRNKDGVPIVLHSSHAAVDIEITATYVGLEPTPELLDRLRAAYDGDGRMSQMVRPFSDAMDSVAPLDEGTTER